MDQVKPIDILKIRMHTVFGAWGPDTPLEDMRREWDALFNTRYQKASSQEISIEGIEAEWISGPNARADRVLLYLHGGGYAMGSVQSHWDLIAHLSATTSCRALGINYRLTPEFPYPAALQDVIRAYTWLLNQGIEAKNIALAGDSAGGGLTLQTLLALREDNIPLPAAAALMSPWIDLEATGGSFESRKAFDPMVRRHSIQGMAQIYLSGQVDIRDSRVAPLHADLSNLPPLLIQVGDHETLLDDSLLLAARAKNAGVDVTLEVWEEMIHVFQLFAHELEEAVRAIKAIGNFVRKHMESTPK